MTFSIITAVLMGCPPLIAAFTAVGVVLMQDWILQEEA